MSHYKPYPAYKDSGVEWLREVPEHWGVVCLSRILSAPITDGPHETPVFLTEGIPFLSVDGIQNGELVFDGKRFISEEDHLRFGKKAKPKRNDILLGKAASVGKIARVKTDQDFNIWSPLALIRVDQRQASPSFIEYSLNSTWLQAQTETKANLNTQFNLGMKDISKLLFCIPSPVEQQAINTHLDRETTRIDALIAKKTRFIELLKEKRQALITQAVTKGLNPNVKMKDSGVEWLGEVPEHWDVKPLKLLVESGTAVTYGIVQPGEPLDVGVPFIQTTNMTSGDFSDGKLQFTSIEIASQHSRTELQGGEVLLGIRASIGAAYVAPHFLRGANISRGVARILCNRMLDSEFLVDFFRSFSAACYWDLSKQGSTFNEVSIATVKEIQIPVPPVCEQHEIVKQLKVKIDRHEKLLYQSELSIKLLKERRSALITAAVTGQIDLRG